MTVPKYLVNTGKCEGSTGKCEGSTSKCQVNVVKLQGKCLRYAE